MDILIDWNCQGIHGKWEAMQHLMACNPVCICLLKDYDQGRLSDFPKRISSSGAIGTFGYGPHRVVVMVHQDIAFWAIPLQLSSGSIYLLSHNLNVDDLKDLLGQLPQPFLPTGDFNGQHHF